MVYKAVGWVRLKEIILFPVYFLGRILSLIIPKNKKLWLFSSWKGTRYLDNPKHLYRYLAGTDSGYKLVWVSKDKSLCEYFEKNLIEYVYFYSLKGMYYQLRAGVVFYTHTIGWEYSWILIGPKTKCIELWHGIPMKKIGYDVAMSPAQARREMLVNVYKKICFFNKHDLIVAHSELEAQNLCTAFKVDRDVIKITGSPRNDCLFDQKSERKIIYMPTFRGELFTEYEYLTGFGFDVSAFDRRLTQLGLKFYIKLHPVQLISDKDRLAIDRAKNIFFLENDNTDIYETLGSYEMLVTDFSSVVFDFILLDRPVIFAPFDMDKYISQDRELYFDYEKVLGDNICLSWDAVFSAVEQYDSNPTCLNNDKLKSLFHKYPDSDSSKRVFQAVENLLYDAG